MPRFNRPLLTRTADVLTETSELLANGYAIILRIRILSHRFQTLRTELFEARDELYRFRSKVWNLPVQGSEAVVITEAPDFVDVEVLEDRDLISALNLHGFDCEKCGGDEPLVAVARLLDGSAAIGICGNCYRELAVMSRGEVIA